MSGLKSSMKVSKVATASLRPRLRMNFKSETKPGSKHSLLASKPNSSELQDISEPIIGTSSDDNSSGQNDESSSDISSDSLYEAGLPDISR